MTSIRLVIWEVATRLFRELRYLLFTGLPLPDAEKEFYQIYRQCRKYTMTSAERMYALYKATEYIAQHNIPGDIVECGIYKGGSSMVSALTLHNHNQKQRSLYLYDTYEGMPKPGEKDITFYDKSGIHKWKSSQTKNVNKWCYSSLDDVKKNLYSTKYPQEKFHFVKGKVEETIPSVIPDSIALLRLDTDWYESTYHELVHLFPRLSSGGVLIIDDYGHWKGAREAVDQYFKENNIQILLNRIDYTGRIGIKI